MRKISLIIIISISFIVSSCVGSKEAYAPPVFPVVEKLESKRVSDGLVIHFPFDMFVHGNHLFVLALSEDAWLQVYDKNTGKYIDSFVSKGQGPGEVVASTMLCYDAKQDIVSIYDESSMSLLSFKIGDVPDSLVTFIEKKSMNTLSGVVRRAWPLQENSFLIDGQLGGTLGTQKRFQLYSGDKVVSEYNEYPVKSEEEYLAFLSPIISISPDKKKMAVGTLFGGVLESYDLSKEIKIKETRMFYPPIFEFNSGAIRHTGETIWGFSALCATDDKLYTVLIGDKDPNLFNNISVFDWDGNEKIKYQTDCLVLRLCHSAEEPNKLYGIAFSEDKDFYLVSFDLK